MRSLLLVSLGCGALAVTLAASFGPIRSPQEPQGQTQDKAPAAQTPHNLNPAGGKYIGAGKCKQCHAVAAKGEAYAIWEQTAHAGAWKTLATPAAKEAAKKAGIAGDPQQSPKCLACHTTAFGEPAANVKLKPEEGVSCEACHGPGETHQKKRVREAMNPSATASPVDATEIVKSRSTKTCTQCHNPGGPTYKPFCLKERMKKIEHFDPRKGRTPEEIEKIRNTCEDGCPVCKNEPAEGEKDKEKDK